MIHHDIKRDSSAFVRILLCVFMCVSMISLRSAVAQRAVTPQGAIGTPFSIHHGDAVPRDVREMYDKGLQYLISAQTEEGTFNDSHRGAGVTGMALMAFLASGEDPNFGKYARQIKKCCKSIVAEQDQTTGYLGNSMYHHGFGMLGLAEAYGTVDDRRLWPAGDKKSIAKALELAVRCALTSQKKNSLKAWRYSPDTNDADTSVSGAVMVGLLAARNAGIEVPDTAIDGAVNYFKSMTSDSSGFTGYSGGFGGGMGESTARTSIACLVFSIAKRQDLKHHKATVENLADNLDGGNSHYREYAYYYQSQALFQGDMEAWGKFNKLLIEKLKLAQNDDGSFNGSFGKSVGTSLSLLSLALNYRFLPIYER